MDGDAAEGPRTLADILREAGIDSSGRGGRRRAAGGDPTADPSPQPDPAPGPQPESVTRPDPTPEPEPEPGPAPRGRVLPTLLLLVEVALAALGGVVVYFTFGLLWELYPYLGVAAAALVLAGSASAAQWSRLRRRTGPLPPLVLGAVLLVVAVLTLLPAADVLTR